MLLLNLWFGHLILLGGRWVHPCTDRSEFLKTCMFVHPPPPKNTHRGCIISGSKIKSLMVRPIMIDPQVPRYIPTCPQPTSSPKDSSYFDSQQGEKVQETQMNLAFPLLVVFQSTAAEVESVQLGQEHSANKTKSYSNLIHCKSCIKKKSHKYEKINSQCCIHLLWNCFLKRTASKISNIYSSSKQCLPQMLMETTLLLNFELQKKIQTNNKLYYVHLTFI